MSHYLLVTSQATTETRLPVFRAAMIGDWNLTREDQSLLDDDRLLDEAMLEAARAGLDVERCSIVIGIFHGPEETVEAGLPADYAHRVAPTT